MSPFLAGSRNNGDQHRAPPLPGGNGKNPGGLPKNSRGKQRLVIDRGNPLFTELWRKPSDEWLSRIHFILLQLDRLQLTAVYCNRRGV